MLPESNAIYFPMDSFRAPLFVKNHNNEFYVEGAADLLSHDEIATFHYACESMGHMIPRGSCATGGQWITRIKSQYSHADTRTQEVVRVISKGMLCEKFKDDVIALNPSNGPAFWGSKAQCEAALGYSFSFIRADDGFDVMTQAVSATLDLLDVPATLRHPIFHPYVPFFSGREDILARAFSLLSSTPDGSIDLTSDQSGDIEAQDYLIEALVRSMAYGSVVTYAPPRAHPVPALGCSFPSDRAALAHEVLDSMTGFMSNMLERGWDPKDKTNRVFLARRAPIYNATGSIRHFESFIHPQLIGWRVLDPIVERIVQRATERLSPSDVASNAERQSQ